jgi:hypothetical protein
MIRFLGIGLLLGVFLTLAYGFLRRERRCRREMEGLLLLLRALRGQIDCFSRPWREVVAEFENEALESCGFLPVLREQDFPRALERGRGAWDAETARVLAAFGGGVGRSYKAEQVALCDWALSELEAAEKRQKEEGPRRARLSASLTVVGGLALLLLLV